MIKLKKTLFKRVFEVGFNLGYRYANKEPISLYYNESSGFYADGTVKSNSLDELVALAGKESPKPKTMSNFAQRFLDYAISKGKVKEE